MCSKKIAVLVFALSLCVVFSALLWCFSPSLVLNIFGSLCATAAIASTAFLLRQSGDSHAMETSGLVEVCQANGPRLWATRDSIEPTLPERIGNAKHSIFFVGLSFETTFKNYEGALSDALRKNPKLEVWILMAHPDSDHVKAHDKFSRRPVAGNIRRVVNDFIKGLFESLGKDVRCRLHVKATHYLPRFAARVFDDSTMLLNLYLFKSRANENPVFELRRDLHTQSFDSILQTLKRLFDYAGKDRTHMLHNHSIVEQGTWYGLPRAGKDKPK